MYFVYLVNAVLYVCNTIYAACRTLYLGLEKGIWVYRVIRVMDWPLRIAFFVLNWIIFGLIYLAGEFITIKLWGKSP